MKLTCDLCEGTLSVDLGGQGAHCSNCGLYYPMARLREKLMANTTQAPVCPVVPEPVVEVIPEPVAEEPAESAWELAPDPGDDDDIFDSVHVVVPGAAEAPSGMVWELPQGLDEETIPEPVAEVIPEPVVEVIPEPVVEVIPEPVVEVIPDPLIQTPPAPVFVPPTVIDAPKKTGFSDQSTWKKAANRLVGNIPEFTPRQFVMHNNSLGNGDLNGWIQQGGVGLGDKIYLDGDYSHPYTVCCINDDNCQPSAKAGNSVQLFLSERVPAHKLRQTGMVYGSPTPIVNAYNYAGPPQQFFTYLLVNAFPQCDIYADIPHSELKNPVDFLFCKNGNPVLAVFLVDCNDDAGRYAVKKAARILGAEGISCTHFYFNYRNDTPYVIKRVNEALG